MLDDANPVGRYKVEDASPTDGVVAGTAGVVAGTTTGVVAGVVAGTRGMGARAVGRYRVEDARPTDLEGETGREFYLRKMRRGGLRRTLPSCRSYCGGHTARSQSAIQCLPVRPRISLIRLTMRVTSRSALKKAAEVMPDVRKKAVALLLAWARSA